MDTTDDINDVMVIMTDGWDSDVLSVQENISAVGADGVTTLVVGFGANGFYNTWSLLDMAQGNSNNLFIVSSTSSIFPSLRKSLPLGSNARSIGINHT